MELVMSLLYLILPILAMLMYYLQSDGSKGSRVCLTIMAGLMLLALCGCGTQDTPVPTATPSASTPTPTPTVEYVVNGKTMDFVLTVPSGYAPTQVVIYFSSEVDANTFLDSCVDMTSEDYNTYGSKWYGTPEGMTLRCHGNTLTPGVWYFQVKFLSTKHTPSITHIVVK